MSESAKNYGSIYDLPLQNASALAPEIEKRTVYGPEGGVWKDYVMRHFILPPHRGIPAHVHDWDHLMFTLSGDGMLLCSSVCAMVGGLLTRVVTRKMDPLVATGHSLALGGALLIPAGLLMGAHPVGVHLKGLLILAALVAVSAVGFSFYNQLLRYHPVGQIAIYNAFIPVLGVVLSCLLLGEPFSWRYLLSGALVTIGICAVNLPGKGKN